MTSFQWFSRILTAEKSFRPDRPPTVTPLRCVPPPPRVVEYKISEINILYRPTCGAGDRTTRAALDAVVGALLPMLTVSSTTYFSGTHGLLQH